MCSTLYATESKWNSHGQWQFEAKQGSFSLYRSQIEQVVMQPFDESSNLIADSNSRLEEALLNNRNYPVGLFADQIV